MRSMLSRPKISLEARHLLFRTVTPALEYVGVLEGIFLLLHTSTIAHPPTVDNFYLINRSKISLHKFEYLL